MKAKISHGVPAGGRWAAGKIGVAVMLLSLAATLALPRSWAQEPGGPLTKQAVIELLRAHVGRERIEQLARERGITFALTPATEKELRAAGADGGLIKVLRDLASNTPEAAHAAGAASSQPSSGVAALGKSAEDALQRKDYAAAVKALKGLVAAQPDSTPAWFNLGYAYTALHQNPEAIDAYRKTVALAPDLFQARLNLGILLLEARQPQAAAEQLEKASALKPDHARAHLYYGRALAQAGQPDAAEKQFTEALRLDPKLAIAQFDLGQLELDQKHFPEASAAFQKAVAIDPTLPQAQLGLALASEGLKNNAQAIPYFEEYLKAVPNDYETRFHLARLYLDQKKNDLALASLTSVYQAKPDLPGLAAALGDVNALLRKFPDSEKYYRLALTATPNVADLHRALGHTLLDEQKYPEAESEFRATLKLDPHSIEAARGLSTSIYLQKRYPEVIPLLEALSRDPKAPPGTFFVLATCYDHIQDRPKALAAYEHFLELSHDQNPDQEWQATQRAKLLRRELRK